ncbi:hypothetical protein E2320_015638 [Naja naja]|nr:hypothetical protein E2320_015638 [Naja naja]
MYIAVLRTAALHCRFRDLENMLLDQLVCGVKDLCLQKCFLPKANLTLKMAIEEAQATELSTISAAEIQGSLPARTMQLFATEKHFQKNYQMKTMMSIASGNPEPHRKKTGLLATNLHSLSQTA